MNKALKKKELLPLRAMLRGFMESSRDVRKDIHATKGLEKYNNWDEKRRLGSHARHVLLAYAFLRGIPFSKIESHKNKEHLTSPSWYRFYSHGHINPAVIVNLTKYFCSYGNAPSEEDVVKWIKDDTLYFKKPETIRKVESKETTLEAVPAAA